MLCNEWMILLIYLIQPVELDTGCQEPERQQEDRLNKANPTTLITPRMIST